MAPSSSRTVKNDTGHVRHRHDTRFRDSDLKSASKVLKRKAEAARVLPPGLREEEDDEDWPPKYKKAPPPPKVRKLAAQHPRTGRQQRDPTPPAPRPKVDLRISPERAVDLYDEGWRNTTEGDPEVYERRMRMFYEQLKKDREFNRKKAIENGLLSDPNKPTTLENAITIVGTCQEMCPKHERVERIVQQMVDKCEKVVHPATGEDVPYEDYMVKRFRRSAAGDDEQLPSDIRPPLVLQKTLNYLLEEIVAGPELLSKVHKFVWDRTRAIRNDFSIQQVTKPDDVRVAIDCFERIARFHILALHQLSLPKNVENSDFDAHQELEQLSKTLLSLTYYYDDNRGTVTSPNEAEFRAYTTILEIGYPRPRLEQRANIWDKHVFEDQKVQMSLSLYAMSGGIEDGEGPWFAGTSFELARGNPRSFFPLLKSPNVPYLLACVAEISFYPIRELILESIWNEFKDAVANSRTVRDWSVEDVRAILGFDNVDQSTAFCLSHGLSMKVTKGNKKTLDFDKGHFKREHRRSYPQVFSNRIVEIKRALRTYLELVNGLWASQEGIEEALDDLEASVHESYEPLFVSDGSDAGGVETSSTKEASGETRQISPSTAELSSTPNSSRGFPISNSLPPTSSFGKPTPISLPPFQNPDISSAAQLSANSGEPDNIPKLSSSTVSLKAGKERSPFGRVDPVDPPNPPKTKAHFSAPPGKWQLPKDVLNNYTTNLASPAASTTKISEVTSPQVSSQNTTTQPGPFTPTSSFQNLSSNPFSQVSSGNTIAGTPLSNSNPFQTAPRNPFSQVLSSDANVQSASPAPPDKFKSLSSNPFSQFSTRNTIAQSTPSSTLSPFQTAPRNPFSQVSSQDANAQSASSAPQDLSKSPSQNPFSQISSKDANAQSASPAPLDSSKSVSRNQFSQVSSAHTQALEPASLQPLPLSNIPQPSFGPVFKTSTNHTFTWPEVSPFSGSFNHMFFNNPVGIASLPTLEQLFAFQKSHIQARPQTSFFTSTPQPDPSTSQLDQFTPQPDRSTPQLDQSAFQLNQLTPQSQKPTLLSGQSIPQPDRPTPQSDQAAPQSDQAASQLDQPPPQSDQAALQSDQAAPQLDQAAPQPDQAAPQPDQAAPQPDQAVLQSDQAVSQSDQAALQPDQAAPQPDQLTFLSNKSILQPDQSTPQPNKSVLQPDKSILQLDKVTFQPNKSFSQSGKSTSQPGKPISVIQNATWTFNRLENPPKQSSLTMKNKHEQIEKERAQKEADEYRVMALSKKYIKRWRTTAWKKGLMRRAPERRRRFAESLQQMAKDAARHQEDVVASLLSRKSANEGQQAESGISTESNLTHSTASKKRKSSDVEDHSTPDRMPRQKRSRLDWGRNESMTRSQRVDSGHKRSRTEERPKLSETEELINTLVATRDDYSYLANGSELSYKITQKIRTLLPPVKVDDTRSDYFMLKSLGIDPDTPIIPRTSKKRHSTDDILSTSIKRLKESPQAKSTSALLPPSKRAQSRSSSPLRKSPHQYRDQSETAQSIDFDETENELVAAQGELNDKMSGVVRLYREQRAKWGSGRSSPSSSITPSRSIEYYKEQRAKWGTPTPSKVMKLRQLTSSKLGEVLRAASERYAAHSKRSKQDIKSAIRGAEERQQNLYATLLPGAVSEGEISRLSSLAAAAVTPAGSSAEAAIEL